MIQIKTNLSVSDNSGAKEVSCIKVLGSSNYTHAKLGDFILVSVRQLRSKGNKKVVKGEVCLALILRTKKESHNFEGSSIKFSTNSVILLTKTKKILGTRIFGVLPKKLKQKKKLKFISLGSHFI
jgi:large subunit ribosomal protein L14